MFYCYMNDEIVNKNRLCFICKKRGYCFIFQHTLHVFPRIVPHIGLWVDHKLLPSMQYNLPRLFICVFVGRP